MTDLAVAIPGEESTAIKSNPPPVRLPKLVQGVAFAFLRRKAMRHWIKRYGHVFEINVPFFGRSVVVSDPALVRSVCTARTDQLVNVQPNLSNWFGPGSVFGFDGRSASRSTPAAGTGISRSEPPKLREDHRGRNPA